MLFVCEVGGNILIFHSDKSMSETGKATLVNVICNIHRCSDLSFKEMRGRLSLVECFYGCLVY